MADVAAQLRERIPVNRNSFMRFYDWYHRTYFKTGKFTPVVHVMLGIGIIGYAIEYPHIKHELEHEAKKASEV